MGESLAVSWPSLERLVQGSDPAVYLPGRLQDPFGPLLVSVIEHGGDLLQHSGQLVEDGSRGPLDQTLGVDREEVVDRERHPAADERVDEAVGREDGLGRLQHDDEDRRDGRLVDQDRASPEEDRRRHRQEHDDRDLERPVPYDEHQEVGHHKPDGDPDDEFDGASVPLAERDAEADHGGYGGEEGLAVPDETSARK